VINIGLIPPSFLKAIEWLLLPNIAVKKLLNKTGVERSTKSLLILVATRPLLTLIGVDNSSKGLIIGLKADSITLFWFNDTLNGQSVDMSDRTFQNGLKGLLNKDFLSPKVRDQYWVNPTLSNLAGFFMIL
jgi:hypothetical protein